MDHERRGTVAGGPPATVPFVDHHCHSLLRSWPEASASEWPAWRRCFTESTDRRVLARDVPDLLGYRRFLTALAPLVGAEGSGELAVVEARDRLAGAEPEAYLRMLLGNCAMAALLVDTGYGGPGTLALDELERATGRPVREVVRLESVVEALLGAGGRATRSLDALAEAFETRVGEAIEGGAVALKSVLAYRAGLRLPSSGPAALRRSPPRATCRCSSTPASEMPTSTCPAPTRRCCGRCSPTRAPRRARWSCCTATRSPPEPPTWPGSTPRSTWTCRWRSRWPSRSPSDWCVRRWACAPPASCWPPQTATPSRRCTGGARSSGAARWGACSPPRCARAASTRRPRWAWPNGCSAATPAGCITWEPEATRAARAGTAASPCRGP